MALANDTLVKMNGADSLRIDIKVPRSFFSLLDKDFVQFLDWGQKKYLSLWFKGTASNETLELTIYSNGVDSQRTNISFLDKSSDWQEIVLRLPAPGASPVDLSHISKLRFGMNVKDSTGSFYLDNVSVWDDLR